MRVTATSGHTRKASRERQRQVYEVLRAQLAQPGGYPPSLREIGQQLGFSVGSVDAAIRELVLAGYVSRQPRIARSLRLTHKRMPRSASHAADVCTRKEK